MFMTTCQSVAHAYETRLNARTETRASSLSVYCQSLVLSNTDLSVSNQKVPLG